FSNNIIPHNQYGFIGDNVGAGTPTLNLYTPGAAFARNVIVSAPAQYYPTNNYYPSLLSKVRFIDYTNGNYRLASGSPYKALATDGKDIGCDFDSPGFAGSQ
ncbi:MAG TPA: hypothetical protein VGW76_05625, partial [Pyrinomonadaceae bacterium]|nr:hypothetical protein [Pyrinomonadaceae bacterium]